jgi:putative ABC transport system permease protein
MFRLALRNIFRQKANTALTLTAIMCGVAGLILASGWVNDIFLKLGEALIHSQSGHMQVYKKGFHSAGSRSPEKFLIEKPEVVRKAIAELPEVQEAMRRLNFSGLLSNGRSDLPILGEGVEPGAEAMVGGRHLADSDPFGILIGSGVAQALQLKPGDHVTVLANTLDGALNSLDLEVVGIFQSFSNDYDARAVKIPLAAAQDLLGTRAANAIVVALKRTADTDTVAATLSEQLAPEGLELKTWIELNDFYEKTVVLYRRQFGVLQLIILVMVVLSVTNNVNMTIFERSGEFGTMRALGDRGRRIFHLLASESVLLGAIGSSLGVLLGVALALSISAIGIPMPPPPNSNLGYTAQIQILPWGVLTAFAIGMGATVAAAVMPAARVSRMPLVDALRANV